MRSVCWIAVILSIGQSLFGQCDPTFDPPLSPRIANYQMQVWLDDVAKMIQADEQITWINSSPDTLQEVHLYMYLNAFKNSETTFLRGMGTIFGDDLSKRTAEEWGWIEVDWVEQQGQLVDSLRYIQPDDGNPADQTVLQVPLVEPLLPGDTLRLNLHFIAKMPKTFLRSGYSKDDFFLFVHWFPQLGVYEQDTAGIWGWNCHQFHQSTEFYSDFGTYEVEIRASDHLVMGASGCLMSETQHDDGTITRRYYVEDVIDFAWVVYPCFEEFVDNWRDISIRLLIPPEHAHLADRYLLSMRQSLEYLHEHVGPYPYPIITVMDPPVHAMRSGLMEYPTFITCGSFAQLPDNVHTLEGLVAHEFAHQYFMGMVASNEKEEAWLDEGLVTYFEDRIIDHYYGEQAGYFGFWGIRTGNKAKTRTEYTAMDNPKVGLGTVPGWEIDPVHYKSLVYAKTATTLHTLEGLVGKETMDVIFRTYFDRWKFRHPRGKDFIAVVNEVVQERHRETFGVDLNWFFDQALFDTKVCDYAVVDIQNTSSSTGHGWFGSHHEEMNFQKGSPKEKLQSSVTVFRLGEMVFPQDIHIVFEDGSSQMLSWSGVERKKEFFFHDTPPIVSAEIDPQQKILLDLNLNNNSKTLQPKTVVRNKFVFKAIFWVQLLIQSI